MEESAYSEAFRGPRKSQFQSSERNWPDNFQKLIIANRIWSVSSSMKYFETKFCSVDGIPRCFPFCKMLRNKISKVCFYFCSTVRNFEDYFLPRNGSEQNSKSFLFRGTAGIPSEITICFVYSVL